MRIFFFLLFLPATILAQQVGTFGTVSGHVYCSDTQLPAHMGGIELHSIPEPPAEGSSVAKKESSNTSTISEEIGLDGSFLFPRVPTGNYYIVVQRPGYIAPESQFTDTEIHNLSPETRERIAKSLPTVSVAANKTVTTTIHLHRGASISGSIRFDDGSPVPFIEAKLLRRDKTGQWVPTDSMGFTFTDDLGRFRIAGISAGEYLLTSAYAGPDIMNIFAESTRPLTIYFGDVFFRKDAKLIKLGDGEDSSGDDITIPLSKLHSISGSLQDAAGHLINSGDVALYTSPPDNIEVSKAHIESENSSFHMDYIPEGHYILRVTNARNVSGTAPTPPSGYQSPKLDETAAQIYTPYEAPLEVLGDMSGINLPLSLKAK